MKSANKNQNQKKQPARSANLGGARPGAGRPSAGRMAIGLRISPESRAWLELEAVARGCAMSDVIEQLIDAERAAQASG